MTTPDRTVRQLRLRAGDAQALQRLLPKLDDALRCASLPDAGARLVLVRRLALGPVRSGWPAQQLSRRIEERVRELAMAVENVAHEDRSADCVVFESRLAACTELARRLLQGEDCSAWYWRLVVPAALASASAPQAALRVAEALAEQPEAAVALPHWADALVRAGCGDALAQAVGPSVLARWLAALPVPAGPAPAQEPRRVDGVQRRAAVAAGDGPSDSYRAAAARRDAAAGSDGSPGGPDEQQDLARGSAVPKRRVVGVESLAPTLAPTATGHPRDAAAVAGPPMAPATRHDASAPAPLPKPPPVGARPELPVPAERRSVASSPPDAPAARAVPLAARHPQAHPSAWPVDPAAMPQGTPGYAAPGLPTACGGLLFLLPVLARLGLPAWLGADPVRPGEAPGAFAANVLRAALLRLEADLDDPMHAALAAAAPEPDDPAWAWLHASRHGLRRQAGIGLATLVRRPALVAATPTHIDLYFDLDAVDLRVRRQGLDSDPGWLPWFGRVVSFHYGRWWP